MIYSDLKLFQRPIDFVNGQSHHVKVGSLNLFHRHITDPFLYAIGARLIQGS